MERATGTTPPALLSKPDLDQVWDFPFFVWKSLKGSRVASQGVVNELPYSEFAVWALMHKVTNASLDSLWNDVHLIDMTWVGSVREQLSKDAAAARKPSETPPVAGHRPHLPQPSQERVSVSVPMRQR